MAETLTVAYCVAAALAAMWLTWRFKPLRRLGDILIAYVIGCAVGLSGILPEGAGATLTGVAAAAIPLAIPLMLLSSDIGAWARLAPAFAKSLTAGVAGCAAAVVTGFLIYGRENPDVYAPMGGMLTGLYTGGTANQASLKVALGVPDNIYIVSHAYSIAVSAIYLVFVIFFGRRVLGLILPHFADAAAPADDHDTLADHSGEPFYGLFRRRNLGDLGRAMCVTLGVIALGGALAWGVARVAGGGVFQAVFILTISLLAVCAAQSKRVRGIGRTYEAGTFFILIFSVAVSSQVNAKTMSDIDGSLFGFITVATLGALAAHVLLNALLRIDTDTTLVSSIALICSPPFVPVMAGALGNKTVIGPGIAVGLIGYAVGTYVGFGVAQLLWAIA